MQYDHVVLISLDTLRADAVAANPWKLWPLKYGTDVELRTPVLDELAGGGAFFANCIAAAPYTSAAHASVFTGLWPLRHGVYEFFNRKLSVPTVFTRAHRLGYRTYFKTDFPVMVGDLLGFTKDVDEYFVEEENDLLAALDPSRPTFSFVHFGGLHVPYGFHNLRFGGDDFVAKVAELEGELEQTDYTADQLVETYRSAEDLGLLLRYKRAIQHLYGRCDYDRIFSLYLEGVGYFLERRFAPFLEALLGRLEGSRFLVVLFGDHGEEYDAEACGHFNTLSEGAIRVPVVFWGTDVAPGLYGTRIRSVDVAPTLLELLGDDGRARARLDGRSLAATVLDGAGYAPATAFSQIYTSSTRELVEFQRRVLTSGKKTGSLKHVRYKESVHEGEHKLTRVNYRYERVAGSWELEELPEPELTLETLGEDLVPRAVSDADAARELAARLDDYNGTRSRRAERVAVSERDLEDLAVFS